MSKIRSEHTKPEVFFKKKFGGFVYHPKNNFGSPDFINYKKKVVVFVDGCFWHKCPKHFVEPKSNKKYWYKKIENNILRDKEVNLAYQNSGWIVIRVWEHELRL